MIEPTYEPPTCPPEDDDPPSLDRRGLRRHLMELAAYVEYLDGSEIVTDEEFLAEAYQAIEDCRRLIAKLPDLRDYPEPDDHPRED